MVLGIETCAIMLARTGCFGHFGRFGLKGLLRCPLTGAGVVRVVEDALMCEAGEEVFVDQLRVGRWPANGSFK